MENYQETLKQAGLTEAQAAVYAALLTEGAQKAGHLAKKADLKRGLTYKVLEELRGFGLIEQREDASGVSVFSPEHPTKLRALIDGRAKQIKDSELVLEGLLPALTSQFNMASGSPGISIYEGIEGIERVLNDSLTSKTVVYTYADIEPIVKNIGAINSRYAAKRDRLGIDKKAILLDTPFARDYMRDYHRLSTDIRLIGLDETAPFQSALEIYDGRVAYITFAPEKMMGVIIHDPYLYAMHRYLFEYTWKQAKVFDMESRTKKTGTHEAGEPVSEKMAPEVILDEDDEPSTRLSS